MKNRVCLRSKSDKNRIYPIISLMPPFHILLLIWLFLRATKDIKRTLKFARAVQGPGFYNKETASRICTVPLDGFPTADKTYWSK